jgi:hypothetical protein
MSVLRKRLERIEAQRSPPADATTEGQWEANLYCKLVENCRREQAGEPPIPLTPEEERHVQEMDSVPELIRYFHQLDKEREWREQQRKERTWRDET